MTERERKRQTDKEALPYLSVYFFGRYIVFKTLMVHFLEFFLLFGLFCFVLFFFTDPFP